MPALLVRNIAEKTGIPIVEAEHRWAKAKTIAHDEKGLNPSDGDDYWAYVTGVFKNAMGISDDGAVVTESAKGTGKTFKGGKLEKQKGTTLDDAGMQFRYVRHITYDTVGGIAEETYSDDYGFNLTAKTLRDLKKKMASHGKGHKPDVLESVDSEAHKAATSPKNNLPDPTLAQIESGNYKKGHVSIQGLKITIENPKGSKRRGVSRDGKAWEKLFHHHYGYIKGTVGRDKDHIDVFIGDKPGSPHVYVVNQVDPKTGVFDEHKCLIGFDTKQAADDAYHANYEKGWKGMGSMVTMSMPDFKDWLENGNTKMILESVDEDPALIRKAETFNDIEMAFKQAFPEIEKYQAEQTAFERQLDDYLSGKAKKGAIVTIGSTPPVLLKLGAKDLPVVIEHDTLKKVLHDKHGIPEASIKQIPAQLRDPIMVFDSASQKNSLVVMTEILLGDKTIIVAVHLSKRIVRIMVNDIASIYGKDNDKWFLDQIKTGRLRYVNKTKSHDWLMTRGLYLPKVRGANGDFDKKILSENDIVKQILESIVLPNQKPTISQDQSRKAMKFTLDTQKNTMQGASRPDIGWIAFLWGNAGTAPFFADGDGLARIIAKQDFEKKYLAGAPTGRDKCMRLVDIVTRGYVKRKYGPTSRRKIDFSWQGEVATVSWDPARKTWYLSAWREDWGGILESAGDGDTANEAEKQPWEITKAEYRFQENSKKLEAITDAIKQGKPIAVYTHLRGTSLTKPEHIRIASNGELQIPAGKKWVTLLPSQVDRLAEQAGMTIPSLDNKVSHSDFIEQALSEGKPVPDEVIKDYRNFPGIAWRFDIKDAKTFQDIADVFENEFGVTLDDEPVMESAQIKTPVTVEENIQRGTEAMKRVISKHVNEPRAMYRQDLGWIAFYWGKPGGEPPKCNGGDGVAKIIAKRDWEGLNNAKLAGQKGTTVALKLVEVIAKGKKKTLRA